MMREGVCGGGGKGRSRRWLPLMGRVSIPSACVRMCVLAAEAYVELGSYTR